MEKKAIYGILSGLLWGFLTALLCWVPFGIPALGVPFTALFAPGLLAIVGVRAGSAGFLLAETGYFLGSLLFLGSSGLAVFVLCTIPAATLVHYAKRVSRFETFALTCGGALAGIWGGLYTLSLISGTDQVAKAYSSPVEFIRSLQSFSESLIAQTPDGAMLLPQVKLMFDEFAQTFALLTPAYSIAVAMIMGLIAVLLVSRSVRRSGKEGFMIPPFSQWFLPRSFGLIIALMLLLAIVGVSSGWTNFEAVLMCIQLIFTAAYSLAGLATIDALMLRAKKSKGLRVLTGIGLFVITLGFIPFLTGLFDSLFSIRRRMNADAR